MGNLTLIRAAYETESSLSSESRVARRLEQAWGCSLKKLTVPYRVDFALEKDDSIQAWLEVKCRNYPSTRYPTLMISVLKWETGILHSRTTGLPFIIAIGFTDCIRFYRYSDKHKVTFKWGGRTRATRDNSDIEPVVHIPLELFRDLKENQGNRNSTALG
ncbi:MAG TPA: hypothetical protein VKA60_20965 [Blastocatellia bacterium]|nr:hypothetical protein [Blastocatellia bacterium]